MQSVKLVLVQNLQQPIVAGQTQLSFKQKNYTATSIAHRATIRSQIHESIEYVEIILCIFLVNVGPQCLALLEDASSSNVLAKASRGEKSRTVQKLRKQDTTKEIYDCNRATKNWDIFAISNTVTLLDQLQQLSCSPSQCYSRSSAV